MQITNETKYSEFVQFEKYLSESGKKQLMQAAEKQFGGMYDLKFMTFYACANGDYSDILNTEKAPTVLAVYWLKRFEEFVKEFAETLQRLNVQPTPDEERASQGMFKTDWAESLLVFTQKYFGLPSFKEAEKITIGEILIARRAQYNEEIFRRNMQRIQMQKIKRK